MCSAFQTGAFVRVGETFSATSPIDLPSLWICLTTCDARSGRDVAQSVPGVQLPTTAAAGAGDVAAATRQERSAARKSAAEVVPFGEKHDGMRNPLGRERRTRRGRVAGSRPVGSGWEGRRRTARQKLMGAPSAPTGGTSTPLEGL